MSSSGSWSGLFGYGGAFGYQGEDGGGLMLLGRRMYDPSTGRFLTRDPVEDGRNWYSYCEGDPVNGADPEGLKIRFVGFSKAQEEKARRQIRLIEKTSPEGRQLIFSLVNDKADHVISPPNGPGDPHFNPDTGRVRYDPNENLDLPNHGEGGRDIPSPPDVILVHELGHMYGRNDANGEGKKVQPGDSVGSFENPHRRGRGLPERVTY